MKNKFIMVSFLCVFILFSPSVKAANFINNQTVVSSKTWTIKFTDNIGFDDVTKQGITVTDGSGDVLNVGIHLGQDGKTVIVTAPKGGYTSGESYILNIGNKVHSTKGKVLKNEYKLHFSVKNNTNSDNIVTFKDKKLEQLIRNKISKLTGDIYKSDIKKITELNIRYCGIQDISGIEKLTNLQELNLSGNDIRCIDVLKNLTNLKRLILSDNPISGTDIRSLENALPGCEIIDMVVAKKPNIYLYPEKTEELSVNVTPKGKIIKSIPKYNAGWKITVDPSGKIDNTYDFLFYEASLNYKFTLNKGWIINEGNFNEEMNNILTSIGLNSKEKVDFIEYWSKELKWKSSRYAAYYLDPKEINEAIKLNLSKKPDSILRAYFYFVPLNNNENLDIKKPKINKFKRNGFTVVEWGGICK
ncbi:leucine-rich repeat domain-containing protein [Clostridium sp. 001]|uniref:leucine-rich repeat domain-containing protein n=1 Tax=Clostridium sp. 001 TaxID=1970093 RepID=UPI001C2C48D7|nr:leucine-rich repeat domain-containing protein [Clostridium sp. 001]QXE18512.1 hypothetical protein B5S50_06465 [Clostridium sp. 001]